MCIRDRPLHDALFPLPLTSFPPFFLFTFETVVALMKQTMRLPLLCSPPFFSLGRPRRSACRCGGERGLTRIFRAKRRLVSCAFMTRREIQTTHRRRRQRKGKGGADGGDDLARGFIPVTRPEFRCSPFFYVRRLSRSTRTAAVRRTLLFLFLSEKLLLRASIPFHPPSPSLYVISGKGKKTHDAENINERRRRGTARAAA